jgi:hypothetical protein
MTGILGPAAAASKSQSLDRAQNGATSLEWTLLVAGLVLVFYPTLNVALDALVSVYRLMTTLNALPFP